MREWVRSGDLVVLEPALQATATVRHVIATREVYEELCGEWDDIECEIRYARARAVVDAFIGGLRLAARHPPSTSAKAQIALLNPPEEQVWAFRSREPKPGVRVFGCFAEIDVFVALNTELKENIDADYVREKEKCKRAWRQFFPTYTPLKGTSLADYLTAFHAV